MRIPARCIQCDGRALVYATVRHASFVVRYRRCDQCGTTSKSIQMKIGMPSKHVLDVASDDTDTSSVIHHRRSNDETDSERTTHSARGDSAGCKDSATASSKETEVI